MKITKISTHTLELDDDEMRTIIAALYSYSGAARRVEAPTKGLPWVTEMADTLSACIYPRGMSK